MATTSISKESNGAVKFDYGVSLNPFFLFGVTNVTVKATLRASSGFPKTKIPYIVIGYNNVGSIEILYSEIVNINGVAKPATAKEGAELIATEVFSKGGGSGTGAVESVSGSLVDDSDPANPVIDKPTADDITDATTVGRNVLKASDAAAARTAIGAGTSNLAIGTTGSTAKVGNYVPAWSDITGKPDPLALPINPQAAGYTLVLADNGKLLISSSATAQNYTIPDNSTVAFPAEATQIILHQGGAGQLTIVAAGGVTLNSAGGKLKTTEQFATVTLIKTAINTWIVSGDLTT